ncbi:MAG: hypothetical protein JNL11_13690 [Bdellovibrionaceae bacterium]|nr:hypothetical protein [Pseudobdellovibrionaceae bacterium]
MRKPRNKCGSKTMKDVKVIEVTFVQDDSGSSAERTREVRKLIAQMIELSHKRGRPAKEEEEISNAA